MSDSVSWVEGNFAPLVLAGVTAVLAYVTCALKKVTDHLSAEFQSMPKLIFVGETPRKGNLLSIPLINRGEELPSRPNSMSLIDANPNLGKC